MSGWGSRDFGVDISGGEYQGWILSEVNTAIVSGPLFFRYALGPLL